MHTIAYLKSESRNEKLSDVIKQLVLFTSKTPVSGFLTQIITIIIIVVVVVLVVVVLFFVYRWNRAMFGRNFSMWYSTKRCF